MRVDGGDGRRLGAGRREILDELLKVDADGWKAAIPQIEQHFAQFGDKLPDALDAQLGHLAAALLNG